MFEVNDEDDKKRREVIKDLEASEVEDTEGGVADTGEHSQAAGRHQRLMQLMDYESRRQAGERQQMSIDEDYHDHLQWRAEDAQVLLERGQAPLVYNQGRQSLEWIAGTEKRMRKDYKVLPREQNDEAMAEVKTKLIKYTDDVNLTVWHRSRAFKQAAIGGLSWIEENLNPDPEQEIIYSGSEDWRNVLRDSHSRNVDYNTDARYLFRRRVLDLDYACALLPNSRKHLIAMAGQNLDDTQDEPWYMGERLTNSTETEWGRDYGMEHSIFPGVSESFRLNAPRQSVELIEVAYKVPETVKVFADGEFAGQVVNPSIDPRHKEMVDKANVYETVKMRMRLMLATRAAPCLDLSSPFRHQRFTLIPVWGYRRARDGSPYGVWRGMRDIQDDLNKRHSKAQWALSNNRIIMDEGAVDDIEDVRREAALPNGVIVKRKDKQLVFDQNQTDLASNLMMADRNSQMLRDVGGVTNENLGRDTNASSGRAILAKQDQGSLTTSELFDNLLLAIKQAGRLRLSHIEQFYTAEKVIRITGESRPIEWLEINKFDPATGRILNDVTAREADFVVDTQDYRSSLAQAAMEQIFDLLGKIATFAPQVVMNVLDLVVQSVDIKDKDEWISRIRKINGQRDPSKPMTPEEEQAQLAAAQAQQKQQQIQDETAEAMLAKLRKEIDKLDADTKLKLADSIHRNVSTMNVATDTAERIANAYEPGGLAEAADEIATAGGLTDQGAPQVPEAAQLPTIAPTQP